MSKNMIKFQPGLSLAAFLKQYDTEEQCRATIVGMALAKGLSSPEAIGLNQRQQ